MQTQTSNSFAARSSLSFARLTLQNAHFSSSACLSCCHAVMYVQAECNFCGRHSTAGFHLNATGAAPAPVANTHVSPALLGSSFKSVEVFNLFRRYTTCLLSVRLTSRSLPFCGRPQCCKHVLALVLERAPDPNGVLYVRQGVFRVQVSGELARVTARAAPERPRVARLGLRFDPPDTAWNSTRRFVRDSRPVAHGVRHASEVFCESRVVYCIGC